MNNLTLFFGCLAALSAGVCLFCIHMFLRLRRPPVSQIADAAPGAVKFLGRAVAKASLVTSEFSKADCLYFQFTVREDLPNRLPKFHVKHEDHVPFMIEDNTGSIDVDIGAADFRLKNTKMNRVGGPFSPDEEMQSLLNRYNIEKAMNNSIRAEECVLLPDTPVVAIGHLKLKPDGTRTLSSDSRRLLITDKSDLELGRSLLLIAFIGLLGAAIFAGLIIVIETPDKHVESTPLVRTIEQSEDL